MSKITAGLHSRDGVWVPEVEECVEAFGQLTEPEFRHIIEDLIGRPRERYRPGSDHFVFSGKHFPSVPMDTATADTVCAYLRTLAVAYDRETTIRWSP